VAACTTLMPIADRQIERHGWLAGETISLADFTLGAQLYRYYTLDFPKPDTPALDAYYTRLTERPAYAQHVMVSYESLRVAGA
jgi:glutathione S-transferase